MATVEPAIGIRALAERVRTCFACCDGMDYVHVLDAGAGPSPGARVMFIGEAPGRLGAARTGIPFTADQTGRRFGQFIAAAGLRRDEVFVANTLLCNPLRDGRNRRPSRGEIARCSRWLKAQVDLVRPALVVTLGTVALEAVRLIERHTYVLRRDAGRALPWYGRALVPLYHPSPRTAARRSFASQLEDFRALGEIVRAGPEAV